MGNQIRPTLGLTLHYILVGKMMMNSINKA